MAEEDLHCGKKKKKSLIKDKVNKDGKTICMSNIPDPPKEPTAPNESIPQGPVTFSPSPPIAENEDPPLAAADNQAVWATYPSQNLK